jgi:hypothetical protein
MVMNSSNFKSLTFSDRSFITNFTKQFPPYNDFEFLSLWVYNIENRNKISIINDNLAIGIQDFVTGDYFYSFIGVNRVRETISTLLRKSIEEGCGKKIKLVPELVVKSTPEIEKFFLVKEDPDSFDYILSTIDTAEMSGGKYQEKRNLVNNFCSKYSNVIVRQINFNQEKDRLALLDLFDRWKLQKKRSLEESNIEFTALQRMINAAITLDVIGVGVFIMNKLIGFATYHIVNDEYAILSFEKGDIQYKGIYEFLKKHIAMELKARDIKYINYEQDLGLLGLKKAKQLWRPVFFLKKYTIEEKIK